MHGSTHPQQIATLLPRLIEERLAEGLENKANQVAYKIRLVCPEFAESWAYEYVIGLVLEGVVPGDELIAAVRRYLRQLELGRRDDRPPVKNRAAYLASCLREVLARHGQPWRKLERRA